MAKEMGLDRAPIEFRKLVFLVPPTLSLIGTRFRIFSSGSFSVCSADQFDSFICSSQVFFFVMEAESYMSGHLSRVGNWAWRANEAEKPAVRAL